MQTSATRWNAFRGVGKAQTSCLKVSEASEGASGTLAKIAGYQENFAGGRSRPEGSEGAVRDASQDCQVLGKLRRRPQPPRGVRKGPSGTPAKHAGYQENFAGGRSRPEESEGAVRDAGQDFGYQENFAGGRSRPEGSEGAQNHF